MRKRYGGESDAQARDVKLRDTPASDTELARILRYREAGTSPGNPKWYRPQIFPKTLIFKPGMCPVYPRLPTGQQFNIARDGGLDRAFPGMADSKGGILQYIAAFDSLNQLKPCAVDLITPTFGNFG